jgi:ABC-2 type transport system ATP-binding protein
MAVSITGLRVTRGKREVLHEINVRIGPGSVTGLVGPSGCGKSTLLRSVVGVQIVAGGSIEVLGLPAGSPALRKRIGYSTQAPAVYTDASVTENLRYFATVLGAEHADITRVVGEVGLGRFEHQLAGNLSGGQLSRLSLAVALLGRPEVVVLDEPTVGLDPVLREELWKLFFDLRESRNATLLISTHVMDEAARCEQLILMREGRILAHDAPARLCEQTGAPDIERAFLALVKKQETVTK